MRIFDSLRSHVPQDATIEDVSIGIFWTCVKTQYGCALSATAHRWNDDPTGALIPEAGHLTGMRVHDLAYLYDSDSLSARALANAAVSASFDANSMTGNVYPGRAQKLIESLFGDKHRHIALIGHFHFADDFRQLGHHVDIFELDHRCQEGDIPSSLIPQKLCDADIVVMTSSTLITHSTEQILACCRNDAFRMIVGPTVPIHPVLWEFGLDAICGSIITDPENAIRAVREGATHRQIPGCEKLNFIRDKRIT